MTVGAVVIVGVLAGVRALHVNYWSSYWSRTHVGYNVLKVPIRVLVTQPSNARRAPIKETYESRLETVNRFYKKYGIQFTWGQIEFLNPDDKLNTISTDKNGGGELSSVIDQFYQGSPVVLFAGYIDDPQGNAVASGGVTADTQKGLVYLPGDWNILAHELGHVLINNSHPEATWWLSDNLMEAGIANEPTSDPFWLSSGQVSDARNRITDMNWNK